jgi:LmbE family N-acetylglucosaminyl deacetylase
MRASECHSAWERLPVVSVDQIIAVGRVLVLAPHPDDESLGCGGLIAACCVAARPPVVAVLTDGSASHRTNTAAALDQLVQIRASEVRLAATNLGLPSAHLHLLGFRDGALGQVIEPCVQLLTRLGRDAGCRIIVAPWQYDPNEDHHAASIVARAVAAAIGAACLFYPVWGWAIHGEAELPPHDIGGLRLDIAAYLPEKRRAIVAHESQYFGLPDDPTRHCLSATLLAACQRPFEVFLTD